MTALILIFAVVAVLFVWLVLDQPNDGPPDGARPA